MEIPFTKLQGNGNDFILIDEFEKEIIPEEMKADFAALFCDRHFGIGGDGILFLSHSGTADIRMRILQPDRSEAEMCGNGVRCFAKYALDTGYVKESCRIETLAGIIPISMRYADDDFSATLDMPAPRFSREEIPAVEKPGVSDYREMIGGNEVFATNVGVPHAVVFVESAEDVAVEEIAPSIRWHDSFPKGANVNFVERTGSDSLRIRTYERGVEGETLSCGTGATASAAVAGRLGYVGNTVKVETVGGPLLVYLKDVVRLEGPAATVFSGTIRY